jgi:hypothetical protein
LDWILSHVSWRYAADKRYVEMQSRWEREGGYVCGKYDENIAILYQDWGIDIPEGGCEDCHYYALADLCPYAKMRYRQSHEITSDA